MINNYIDVMLKCHEEAALVIQKMSIAIVVSMFISTSLFPNDSLHKHTITCETLVLLVIE